MKKTSNREGRGNDWTRRRKSWEKGESIVSPSSPEKSCTAAKEIPQGGGEELQEKEKTSLRKEKRGRLGGACILRYLH
jgi:hypothetical protein